MLPNLLSSNLCSLNPGVERFAFSVFFDMTEEGEILLSEGKILLSEGKILLSEGKLNFPSFLNININININIYMYFHI